MNTKKRKYRKLERLITLIGLLSFISIISILSYSIYMKFFYVASQPFEIYTSPEDIEKILSDYESKLGKKKDKPNRTGGTIISSKRDVIVIQCKDGKFGLKYLLDGNMEFRYSKDDYWYEGETGNYIYYFITKESMVFNIVSYERYEGQTEITSAEIMTFASNNKWIGKYKSN